MISNEDKTIQFEILDHKMIPDTHIFKVRILKGKLSDDELITACDNRSLKDKIARHFGGFVRHYSDFIEVHVFFN